MAETRRQSAIDTAAETLTGGGDMGAMMRAHDWSATSLGSVENWPQSLRTAVSICLNSRFPIIIFWGRDLIQFYNDAFRPILGATKHPAALGQQAKDCWPEIWDIVGPMLYGVLDSGIATWSPNQMLFLDRSGYAEECFFTSSYSPIRVESGEIDGVFTAVTETTGQVVGERRLQTLRDLAESGSETKAVEDAYAAIAHSLANNNADIPFAALFRYDADTETAHCAATVNLQPDSPACPQTIVLGESAEDRMWPLATALRLKQVVHVPDVQKRFGALPGGLWPDPPHSAVVLPVVRPGHEVYGALVVGVSPRRALDDEYLGFFNLVAGHVATAIANALAHEEERRRAEALAEIDRAKTAFFSNVSHEFRTPLTLLLGPVEDALNDTSAVLLPVQRKRLELVQRNALRLLKLVNSLLDFSRISADRIQAVYEPTDLSELTADLASLFRSAIERSGLHLKVECPPLPEPVYVDREMWEKIILNLLSNALKFTFAGEIAVTLKAEETAAVVTIRDTGTGISATDLPHIFERFHRVRGAQSRTLEGTGIGLALVKELVELQGGTVSVESTVGSGTTFTICMPFGTAHLPADRIGAQRTQTETTTGAAPYVAEALRWLPAETESENEAPAMGETTANSMADIAGPRPYILLADDNADMRDYVQRLLSPAYTVEVVADGAAALTAAQTRVPDLVLSDVMMPHLDGFGLLRALRTDPATQRVPVILLSARAGEEAAVEGLEAGADDYLVKPFVARELLARVQVNVRLARLREAAIAALASINAHKDLFISIATHELRTPLTALKGYNQFLQRDIDRQQSGTANPPDWARYARITANMDRQVNRLTGLIGQMNDLSRVQSGMLEIGIERGVDLVALVRQVTAQQQDASRDHVITIDAEPPVITITADPGRIEQVINNLISNAIKYSPENSRVSIECSQSNSEALIRVTDEGSGIDLKDREHIFDQFYRIRSIDGPRVEGLGLGLYISSQIVRAHNGRIWVESTPGQGSSFFVALPLDSSGNAA